jgi:hypothetical protein
MRSVIHILQELLADGRSQTELARDLGVSQPTVSRWLDGAEPKTNQLNRIMGYAKNKGIVNGAVLDPELTVPVVGFAGAGGEIDYSKGQGPFGEARMPPGASKATVAVIIRGDSMAGQLDDGWTVYYDDRHEPPTTGLYGKLCVVGLTDGRVLIRRIYPGRQPGCYDLQPTNAPTMLDQAVEWAAKITFIAPN